MRQFCTTLCDSKWTETAPKWYPVAPNGTNHPANGGFESLRSFHFLPRKPLKPGVFAMVLL